MTENKIFRFLAHAFGVGFFMFLAIVLTGFGVYHYSSRAFREVTETNKMVRELLVKQNSRTILMQFIKKKQPNMKAEDVVRAVEMMHTLCSYRNIPLSLACGVVDVETGGTWNPDAHNKGSNAYGWFQTLPSTARPYLRAERINYTPTVLSDPTVSTIVGINYLADLHEGHVEAGKSKSEDFSMALHSYCWGPSSTEALYGGAPRRVDVPNLSYSQKVLAAEKKFKEIGL